MAVPEAGARTGIPPAASQVLDRQDSEPRVSDQALTFGERVAEEEAFQGPLAVVALRTAVWKRWSRLSCFLKRRACSCFSIIITKSKAQEEGVALCGDTVTSCGYWTACTNDTLLDNYRYCHQNESLVRPFVFLQPLILIRALSTVNGRHLSADVTFIEKRRRGLVRFANALVRHPVLSQEQLVTMFLTVPTVSTDHGRCSAKKLMISTRSLQYGERRLRNLFRKSLLANLFPQGLKIPYQPIFRKPLRLFVPVFASRQNLTSVFVACWNA